MKILHFADLHLGTESYGVVDQATGLSSRLLDILKTLDYLVDYAIENLVDLVLFCGDAYKSRDPTQTQQREFARRIHRLSQAGIPFFLLVGNHDMPNAMGKATTMEIFDTLAVSNVYIANTPGVYPVETASGILQIAALPWLRRSTLLTREAAKNLTAEEINERLQEAMTERIRELSAKVDTALPCVLAAHVWVASARVGSEKGMLIGKDPTLLLSNVALPAFDYVALGHLHHQQVLSTHPPVVYAGSLERLDFNDAGTDKGFYLVEIKASDGTRRTDFQFIQAPARPFVSVQVEITDDDAHPMETIMAELTRRQPEFAEAIVRVRLSLPAASQTLVNDSELRKVARGAAHLTISREVRTASRSRLGAVTVEDLTPMAALKLYLDAKKVTPERQKVLLQYGEQLMAEALSPAAE